MPLWDTLFSSSDSANSSINRELAPSDPCAIRTRVTRASGRPGGARCLTPLAKTRGVVAGIPALSKCGADDGLTSACAASIMRRAASACPRRYSASSNVRRPATRSSNPGGSLMLRPQQKQRQKTLLASSITPEQRILLSGANKGQSAAGQATSRSARDGESAKPQPISLAPLSFEDALRALVATPSMTEKPKRRGFRVKPKAHGPSKRK